MRTNGDIYAILQKMLAYDFSLYFLLVYQNDEIYIHLLPSMSFRIFLHVKVMCIQNHSIKCNAGLVMNKLQLRVQVRTVKEN